MKFSFIRLTLFLVFLPLAVISQIFVPDLFSDQMVIQRATPVPLWGKTAPSVKITAVLGLEGSTGVVEVEQVHGWTDPQGHWELTLSPRPAGGPYQIKIMTAVDTVIIHEILIGEVWICSGQSNMEWALKNSKYGKEALEKANRSNLRLFHLKKIHNMYNAPFTEEQTKAIDQYDFFEQGKWVISDEINAAEFSAVGYYFANLLQDSLENIPIGIIQNAVSGSPAQSWYRAPPEEVMHWLDNDTYHPWLAERANQNWTDQSDGLYHHHPFEPGYLFQSAVLPLAPFPVRGVLWYQGESNATHPESYFSIMKRVIEDWREVWGYELPFYSVQLPRIANRSRWPEFRAAQREVLKLPNTGMISIIDEGHSTDVHPTHKRVVGHRLAWLILRQIYQNQTAPISPELAGYEWHEKERTLSLSIRNHGIPLVDYDPDSSGGIELLGYSEDGRQTRIIKPDMSILDSTILLKYPTNFLPVRIQYAWKPFPEGIIFNLKGMPLVPFKVDLPGNN